MTARPVVFALRGRSRFPADGADRGKLEMRRDTDRELIASVATPLDGSGCVVIGSVVPPETARGSGRR